MPFEYLVAESASHAAELLAEHREEAKIIAGGQSLIPLLTRHLARPRVLVSINRIAELERITVSESEITIGAGTPARKMEQSTELAAACPLLVTATRYVGHANIRTRGTIGGSLAHNDPAAEYPAVLLALGAFVTARSPRGTRRISVDTLISGRVLETSLEADEILESITIPLPSPSVRFGFAEFAPRRGDYAVAGICTVVSLDREGAIAAAAMSAFGGSRTARLRDAESAIVGASVHSDWSEMEQLVRESFPTTDDIYGSASYRTHLASVLARRALVDSLRPVSGR